MEGLEIAPAAMSARGPESWDPAYGVFFLSSHKKRYPFRLAAANQHSSGIRTNKIFYAGKAIRSAAESRHLVLGLVGMMVGNESEAKYMPKYFPVFSKEAYLPSGRSGPVREYQ